MSGSKRKPSSNLKRRKFIELGIASAAGLASYSSFANISSNVSVGPEGPLSLKTSLCKLLKIEYPVLQAGMGGFAGPELVASISEAGGLGILGGSFLAAEELRSRIRRVRQLTKKPFGVNLLLQEDLLSPLDVSKIPDKDVESVQQMLNQFRKKLNIPESNRRPLALPSLTNDALTVILEENVPVFSIGLGNPGIDLVKRFHEREIKVVAMIATVEDAKTVAESGVDVIVAQGSEAGGHRSTWKKGPSKEAACIGTLALVPQVVDAVKQPVVAAGGITDGRGLAAALALGATGILLGTRFMATKEAMAVDFYKQALIQTSSNNTTVTDKLTGAYARVIRNTITEEYEKAGAPVLPPFIHSSTARDIYNAAIEKNKPEFYTLYAGQSVGNIKSIPAASEVLLSIIKEAREVVKRFPQYLK